jgi:hypothetical protein
MKVSRPGGCGFQGWQHARRGGRVENTAAAPRFAGTDGLYQMTITPTIMLNGQFTRLGTPAIKFLAPDEVEVPRAGHSSAQSRKFNEELRTALGVPTFYNEALSSVSQISVYDRVKGRKGDGPTKQSARTANSGH